MQRSLLMIFAIACFSLAGCGTDGTIEPSAKVFKSRGSIQCAEGGTAPEIMKNELITAGIEVRSFSCGSDGLAHPAVCGGPDGAINIFDIPQSMIAQAQSLGFASLTTLPNAQETQCR
jgi:hypothetical protein